MNETLRCNRNEAACLISLVMMDCIYIVMTEKDSAALTPVHADLTHLSLDVSHALVVQFGRRTHLENEPRSRIVIRIKYNGERQQEQAHKYPPLVNYHVI